MVYSQSTVATHSSARRTSRSRHTERAGRHSLTHTHTHASRHGMPQVAESLSSPQPYGLRMIASARSRWPTVNTVRPSLDLETLRAPPEVSGLCGVRVVPGEVPEGARLSGKGRCEEQAQHEFDARHHGRAVAGACERGSGVVCLSDAEVWQFE